MSIYSIQMGQAAIVSWNRDYSNGLFTGGDGNDREGKLQKCSAIVVPGGEYDEVGMYHFPSGALNTDKDVTEKIIRTLIERLEPEKVWIYWGRGTEAASSTGGSSSSRHYAQYHNEDVDAIAHYINENYPKIKVKPPASDGKDAGRYCARNGTTKAYFDRYDGIVCVASGRVWPEYKNMISAEKWPPGKQTGACLIIANTEEFGKTVY